MAILEIPTRTDSDNYEVKVTLDGEIYAFAFAWNYRSDVWEMSIDNVVDGLAVRVGVDLLKHVSAAGKPPGNFAAYDTSNKDLDPGLEDLGGRVLLLYQEAGDE